MSKIRRSFDNGNTPSLSKVRGQMLNKTYFSPYNIYRTIEGRRFVANLLTGSIDELSDSIYKKMKHGSTDLIADDDRKPMLERGYLQDKKDVHYKYLETLSEIQKNQGALKARLFIPLTTACNLSCTYCFQKHKRRKTSSMTDTIFNSIEKKSII